MSNEEIKGSVGREFPFDAPSAWAIEKAREIGSEIRKYLFVTSPMRASGPLVQPGLSYEADDTIARALDAARAEGYAAGQAEERARKP